MSGKRAKAIKGFLKAIFKSEYSLFYREVKKAWNRRKIKNTDMAKFISEYLLNTEFSKRYIDSQNKYVTDRQVL